ncbi:MAG: OmpA family protein [Gemmatimonadota bacterium]|nr:OmpA family protein [Gemmatimonadota bacterium]
MKGTETTAKRFAVAGILGASLVASGCAHVNREELGVELATIRQEMAAGDQAVEERLGGRIDGVESRVDGVEGRVDLLEQDLSALENRFNVTVERMAAATRVNTPIYFGFDEADLQSQDQELLSEFSSIVMQHFPNALVTVEGFTDPAGSEAYNLRLGQRRASAVREYLVAEGGMNPDRVRAVSYGEDTRRQVVPGATRDEGQQNRRVVMVIDHSTASSEVAGR